MSKGDGQIWSDGWKREVVAPTVNERGREEHPSWVMLRAYRGSTNPPVNLFDSDIRHSHTVTIEIASADRDRSLGHDHIMGWTKRIEVELSEAQWAAFVSSLNTSGVPATLRWDVSLENPLIPSEPYAPRLQESMDEVHDAGERAVAKVREAFEAYKAHKTVGNLRTLEAMIENMPGNMTFAAKSLSEHAENVVTKARADIEATVVSKARQLGIDPAELGDHPLELEAGDQ